MSGQPEILTPSALIALLSRRCEMAGGQSAWGRRYGILPSVVSDTIRGKRAPSEAVLNAMGLMRVERFVPIKRGSNE